MKRIDANIVLRYLLDDHAEHSARAAVIMEEEPVMIAFEVVCEVVYVLGGVYGVGRKVIASRLDELIKFENIETSDAAVLACAFQTYAEKKIDFVDALLFAHAKVRGDDILTFDKKLNRLLESAET